jgi:hypothetical protein
MHATTAPPALASCLFPAIPSPALMQREPTHQGPRGVATSPTHIALTSCSPAGDHLLHLFSAAGDHPLLHTLGGPYGALPGQLNTPVGVRLTRDGARVAVADYNNGRIAVFRVSDGAGVGSVPTPGVDVTDIEEVCPSSDLRGH